METNCRGVRERGMGWDWERAVGQIQTCRQDFLQHHKNMEAFIQALEFQAPSHVPEMYLDETNIMFPWE